MEVTIDPVLKYDNLTQGAETALRHSAQTLLDCIKPGTTQAPNVALQGLVWPQLSVEAEWSDGFAVILKLFTLERLGIEPGKSGSRVLIGYFAWPRSVNHEPAPDIGVAPTDTRRPSRLMVIKVSVSPEDTKHHTEYEAGRSFSAAIYNRREQFALPLFQTHTNGVEVLWAPFATGEPDVEDERDPPLSTVPDLYGVLLQNKDAPPVRPQLILAQVFRLMHQAHCRSRGAVPVTEAFRWYLRNHDSKESWAQAWIARWGDGPEVAEDGDVFKNPWYMLNRLKAAEIVAPVGFVHGDLHPKNVVIVERSELKDGNTGKVEFDRDWRPHIIDYGWSRANGPIAADFVLMECNLRFMLLPAATPPEQVKALADWLFPSDAERRPEGILDPWVNLIDTVRQDAYRAMLNGQVPDDETWARVYGVPLFLVALGLLKHSESAFNLSSATRTILTLATRLHDQLFAEAS